MSLLYLHCFLYHLSPIVVLHSGVGPAAVNPITRNSNHGLPQFKHKSITISTPGSDGLNYRLWHCSELFLLLLLWQKARNSFYGSSEIMGIRILRYFHNKIHPGPFGTDKVQYCNELFLLLGFGLIHRLQPLRAIFAPSRALSTRHSVTDTCVGTAFSWLLFLQRCACSAMGLFMANALRCPSMSSDTATNASRCICCRAVGSSACGLTTPSEIPALLGLTPAPCKLPHSPQEDERDHPESNSEKTSLFGLRWRQGIS